ncbi:MAG: glycine zipper 2TM domain-containing protein [Phycisphaerae bacterium]|nr:glycine zipper 2TM domain-containing protein [Phycisphaerae bacterium]
MRTLGFVLLVGLSLVLVGCTTSESHCRKGYDFYQIDKIAVVDVIGPVGSEAAKNQIADFFVMELLKKGYSPIERAQVQIILNEQKFQSSDVTSRESVANAGEILNVPVILFVNVPKFKEEITISAKMVDVQDGSILWMGTGTGTTGKTLNTILGAAGGAIVGGAVSNDDNRVIGAIGGGVAGGAAGALLSPQVEQKVRSMIGKICESLPTR